MINFSHFTTPFPKSTLHHLLTRIGSSTSGLKNELVARLDRDVRISRFPAAPSRGAKSKGKKGGELVRILSIDMGIRNLAFCVVDVERPGNDGWKGANGARVMEKGEAQEVNHRGVEMKIVAWRRLDVLDEVSRSLTSTSSSSGASSTASLDGLSTPNPTDSDTETDPKGPYSPPTLSQTAYTLLKHTLLPYNPSIILIERQRWRTNSAPSIQQWTLRVNTLEAMLWAILTALREEAGSVSETLSTSSRLDHDYDIQPVDPKRVAAFWLGPGPLTDTSTSKNATCLPKKRKKEQDLTRTPEHQDLLGADAETTVKKPLSRGKAEKKFKIALLRSWLEKSSSTCSETESAAALPQEGGTTTLGHPNLRFTFSTLEAQSVRDGLLAPAQNGKTAKRKKTDKDALRGSERGTGAGMTGKMDDVTDCFLQAAAWVAWEANRVRMLEGADEVVRGALEGEGERKKQKGKRKEEEKAADDKAAGRSSKAKKEKKKKKTSPG